MPHFSKQIVKIAQSDMSRNALSHWLMFRLPEPNEKIDALVAKLAKVGVKHPPKSGMR